MRKSDYAAVYRHVQVLKKCGLAGVYEVGRSSVIYLKNRELFKVYVRTIKKLL